MTLPTVTGIIKRRLLVNYRADPAVVKSILPEPFKPLTHDGYAIVGVCLIRLEHVRPALLPGFMGISSENAAHRFAVEWTETGAGRREGVFIPRRDTDSVLNRVAGGRLFPGEHQAAKFRVADSEGRIEFSMRSEDETAEVELVGSETETWPESSCFSSLSEASKFFEAGKVGYSMKRNTPSLDGLELDTFDWQVRPFAIEVVRSSYFEDPASFPQGSISFDHALIMRDLHHQWHAVPPLKASANLEADARR